ncbi:hypothetical protein BK120_21630 [Paenibacillus sp. FSL A5-0031]|uniref:helix-turn-helix domain-containing protein n=1 Tax=Paenibacillus sp. FSL A5-0031 TaxID=1920420 RepID=UPI00096DF6E9|nr:helix-turn-helix transcriptional regulator [Paenibacillus sp. FSL A5-0031]OME79581.1 hypothetical protein BK120_21630 [Paenibacillus sp. FSL A5-0031]
MNSYSNTLKQYVNESGLSLREISRRCSNNKTPVSQAYISKLINNDIPPASEEVNKALAKATNCNPEKLIIAAQTERLKPVLDDLGEEGFENFLNAVSEMYAEKFYNHNKNNLDKNTDEKNNFTESYVKKMFKEATSEEKINMSRYFSYSIIGEDGSETKIPSKDEFNESIQKIIIENKKLKMLETILSDERKEKLLKILDDLTDEQVDHILKTAEIIASKD